MDRRVKPLAEVTRGNKIRTVCGGVGGGGGGAWRGMGGGGGAGGMGRGHTAREQSGIGCSVVLFLKMIYN